MSLCYLPTTNRLTFVVLKARLSKTSFAGALPSKSSLTFFSFNWRILLDVDSSSIKSTSCYEAFTIARHPIPAVLTIKDKWTIITKQQIRKRLEFSRYFGWTNRGAKVSLCTDDPTPSEKNREKKRKNREKRRLLFSRFFLREGGRLYTGNSKVRRPVRPKYRKKLQSLLSLLISYCSSILLYNR